MGNITNIHWDAHPPHWMDVIGHIKNISHRELCMFVLRLTLSKWTEKLVVLTAPSVFIFKQITKVHTIHISDAIKETTGLEPELNIIV